MVFDSSPPDNQIGFEVLYKVWAAFDEKCVEILLWCGRFSFLFQCCGECDTRSIMWALTALYPYANCGDLFFPFLYFVLVFTFVSVAGVCVVSSIFISVANIGIDILLDKNC